MIPARHRRLVAYEPSPSGDARGNGGIAGALRAPARNAGRPLPSLLAALLLALAPALLPPAPLAAREKEPHSKSHTRGPAAKTDAGRTDAGKTDAGKADQAKSNAAGSTPEAAPAATGATTAPPVPPPASPQPDAAARAAAETATRSDQESVEADVSTRSVAVTSAFRGSEVVIFGTVLNSRQESAESGLYDVVLVVEGSPTQAVVRHKSNVGGIWLNTSSLKYDRVPSYFAIVSTRPLDEIADDQVLAQNGVGFKHIRLEGALGVSATLSNAEREAFRTSVIRLKQKEGLYFTEDYGVTFIGKALFRSTVTLPATVKVGPVAVHVLLFRDGELLSRMTSRVVLTRQGLEHFIYATAFTYPLLYGLVAVAIAVAAGLLASLLVRR